MTISTTLEYKISVYIIESMQIKHVIGNVIISTLITTSE